MKKLMILTMMVIPVMVGCGHSRIPMEFTPYESISRKAKGKDYVVEITRKSALQKPYKVIGTISATRAHEEDPMVVFEKLRKLAKKKGGDALVDLDVIVRFGNDFLPEGSVQYRAELIAYDELDILQVQVKK